MVEEICSTLAHYLTQQTSFQINNLPGDGRDIHATLWYRFGDGAWRSVNSVNSAVKTRYHSCESTNK